MNDERDCLNYLITYYHKQVKKNNFVNITKPISPLYVGFKITEKCNQNCKHCWAGKSKVTKSYDDICLAMEKIATYKIMHFTITGGDPLLHPEIYKIIDLFYDWNILLKLHTTGITSKENIDI